VVGCLVDHLRIFAEHPDLLDHSSRLTAAELMERHNEIADLVVLDVRNPRELVDGAIPGALNVPLASLMQRIDELDRTRPTVVYCASGYRSMIAASVLSAAGFADVSDLLGGYAAWAAASAAA
jgi:rhodanese-related sulfurtransferase